MSATDKEASVSFYFYTSLIRFYIPLEAKYVGLRGKKDKTLIQELVLFFVLKVLPHHNDGITLEDFQTQYISELNKIFANLMKEYVGLLLDLMEKSHLTFTKIEQQNLTKATESNEYDKAIEIIEKKLGIGQTEAQNNLSEAKIHVNNDIYKNEFEKINCYIGYFADSYMMLNKKLNNPKTKKSPMYSKIEYVFFVVSHEFLSFLSHYSTAVVFFNSPRVFIDNLHKGIAHLKRALMDIYDGLIVEEGICMDIEYLRIRAEKINSLGNTGKMQDVMISLKDYYEKHRLKP